MGKGMRTRPFGRTADDALRAALAISAEVAQARAALAPVAPGPWLGEWNDPRCKEIVDMERGKVVAAWQRDHHGRWRRR